MFISRYLYLAVALAAITFTTWETTAWASIQINATNFAANGWVLNTNYWTLAGGPPASRNPTTPQIQTAIGYSPLTELYKANVGEADTGTFAASYNTTYSNPAADPANATVSYIAGMPIIVSDPVYLHVKDGNHAPYNYVFNISAWNRTENIELSNFWPAQGAISHVTIFGGTGMINVVPEPTMLLIWSGLGAIAIAAVQRRRWTVSS